MANVSSNKSDTVTGVAAPEDDGFELRSIPKKHAGSSADMQEMRIPCMPGLVPHIHPFFNGCL